MAVKKTLTIDGVDYVRADQVKGEPTSSDIKIVILQRGWVMIGRFGKDSEKCWLDNAYVIRSWGTTKGLGELALEGKQSSTKLDKAGRVEFNELTVVATINADPELWNSELV